MSWCAGRWLVLPCSMLVAIGCGGTGSGPSCTEDADCPSRFCRADGTCAPVVDADAGPGAQALPDAPSELCAPDHDGNVELAELPHTPGKMATYRVALDAAFDTAGTATTDGARRWDLTGQLANDVDRSLSLESPTGAWWSARFPDATYASLLAADADLLGVFRVEPAQLVLLGVVSPEAGTFRTELAYDPPAKILALPVTAGGAWSSTSTVSGTAQGAIVAYTERYSARVDQVGTMATPYGEFPVVRVATDLSRSSLGTPIGATRTFSWIAECFGPVATVRSQDFESETEFSDPAEVRRLAP